MLRNPRLAAVLAMIPLLALAIATRAEAGPATSFPMAVVATDCSQVTIAGNWITPVNGQDNVFFQVHDLKTGGGVVASDAITSNQTSAEHEFAISALAKGKHRFRFDVQVRVGTAPIIGSYKIVSIECAN